SESSEPLALIAVKDRSVATSGSSQRGFRINGRWYSHIFDPRSGQPVDRIASATVIAERSVDADAFAKVCNLLAPEESIRMARALPGVECLIITKDGRIARSDGWRGFERPLSAMLASGGSLEASEPPTALEPSWSKGFELVVSLEINQPGAEPG